MNVILNNIDNLQDGSSRFVFITDAGTHFARRVSFTVPEPFSLDVSRFITDSNGMKLDISIIPLSDGERIMELTRYDPCNLSGTKKVFRLSSYTLDKWSM